MSFDSFPEPRPLPAVEPHPAGPRTIGLLNLIFGGVLLLCGGFCLTRLGVESFSAALPRVDAASTREALDRLIADTERERDEAKAEAEKKAADDKSARPKANAEAEKNAADDKSARPKVKADVEKKAVDGEGAQVQAETHAATKGFDDKIAKLKEMKGRADTLLDYSKINADFLIIVNFFRWDIGTAPILNLLMVVAGIGLLKLASWARKLAIAVAAFKLLRLAALTVYTFTAVVPAIGSLSNEFTNSEPGRIILERALEDQRAKGNNVQFEPKEFAPVLTAMTSGFSIAMLVLGSIYPIIVLIVLTRRGAKAACETAPPERYDEFSA